MRHGGWLVMWIRIGLSCATQSGRGSSLALRGGAGIPQPSRPLSALRQGQVEPDDLWPAEPLPGQLDREFHGYLRQKDCMPQHTAGSRIPSVLHRIIFLDAHSRMTEKEFLGLTEDDQMCRAFKEWQHTNAGFRLELHNLHQAEEYIREHYDSRVLIAFRTLLPNAYKSDLFRYLVLYNEGGWYVDLKLGVAAETKLDLDSILDRLAGEVSASPETIGFVAAGQNMVWNVAGAEGLMNAFLGAKPRHPVLGDTIVRVVDACIAKDKGMTPWSLTGPYALFAGLGKRRHDGRQWRDFQGGENGIALMRFGFDEWHLPSTETVVVRKASRQECGGGWKHVGGNNYVDIWFEDAVFA